MASSSRKGSRAAAASATPTEEQPATEVAPAQAEPHIEPRQIEESEAAALSESEVPAAVDDGSRPAAADETASIATVAAPAVIEAVVAKPEAASFGIRAGLAKMAENPLTSLNEARDKVRSIVEAGIAETRSTYSKAVGVADEAASAVEASYATARAGVVELNIKTLEALKANAEANFDFVKSAFSVKTAADYITLHTEFARKQIELITSQTKSIAELAQKVAADSSEPIKAHVSKTFKAAS